MTFRKIFMTAVTFGLAPGILTAQEAGYYVKLFGGTSLLSDSALAFNGAATDPSVSFDGGTFAGGAVGYSYAGPLSAELEFAYRSGDASDGSVAGGDFASTSLLLNAVYSFDQGAPWTPYLGAGLGFATEVDFDVLSGPNAGEYSARGSVAGQIFAGVSWSVTERIGLFGEVRYFNAGSQTLDGPGGATLEADYETLDLAAGLTLSF